LLFFKLQNILFILIDHLKASFVAPPEKKSSLVLFYFYKNSLYFDFSQENGTIIGFPGAKDTKDDLMIAECDILVPAANERQITKKNAHLIQAKVHTFFYKNFVYF